MSKLKLSNGHYYGEDAQGKQVCRGARMGRADVLPDDLNEPIKLRLEKLRWVSGDYDQEGAYWGYTRGTDIYCAWKPGTSIQIFVRGISRRDAKWLVKNKLNHAPVTFYR